MIYIGIVSYNSRNDLPACLVAIAQQTVLQDISVIVLDNASRDDSVAWMQQQAGWVKLIINSENVGFARAHNQIIQFCDLNQEDFYVALNPDVSLAPDYVEQVVDCLVRRKAGWGVGKLLSSKSEQPLFYSVGHAVLRGGYAFNIAHGLPDVGQYNEEREIFGAAGAAVVIRGEMLNDLAPDSILFDPSFFLYYEDVEFDWRARRHGWHCWYQPCAVAYHRGSNPTGALKDEALCNRYLSAIKNATIFDLLTYNLPLIVLHFSVRLLMRPKHGFYVLVLFFGRIGNVLMRRYRPMLPRREMMDWFRWSKGQPTDTPVAIFARIQHSLNRRKHGDSA